MNFLPKHLGLIVLLFLSVESTAQLKEVRVMFDSLDQQVKEKYFVREDNPLILDGPYTSFYLNGNVKSKGQYQNNLPTGKWYYYFENAKLKMESEISENEGGYWKYYFENGNISQEGVLKDGKKTGLWQFYYESGQLKSKGYYKEDKREGNWNIYYEDNTLKAQAIYEGDIAWYREFYPSGELKMEGKISSGKSDSTWTHYYKNGNLKAVGEEKNGLKEGKWVYYHESGEKESEGTYEHGQKNGKWKYYYSDGALNAEGKLIADQKEGYWKLFYNSGASLAEGIYDDGSGKYTEYYESGKVKVKGFVKEGVNDSSWTFFYEDGSIEGQCNYEQGEGEYTGFYKNGKPKMKGKLKNGAKTGVWQLYDEKGKLAGLYKTYYDKEEPVVVEPKDPVVKKEPKKEPESSKPSYNFKQRRRISYFQARINEYRSFILSSNPLQTLFGSFPVALEYYYQERLGYELKVALIRNPFYIANRQVATDVPYERGFYIDLRQKFYFEKNIYGLLYFGHEIRYTRSTYGANLSDPVLNRFFKPSLNEDLVEYSIVFGDRVMESHANKGFTLDVWGGLGVGYRSISRNWTNIPAVSNAYRDVNQDPISIPIRIGITVGYVFKYNPSPLYN
ncbi:toxin-antitoxin system YwqK family antitoxin [Hyphobacterium sp. CCMP332]|nr:toxin-antitoxin system YwqK family antitoxin [Hyphobacterium sp. CCMP332]